MNKHIIAAAVAGLFGVSAIAFADDIKGPSSSATPYYLGVGNKVDIISLLTVGDSMNEKPNGSDPYRLVGLLDGLGAYDNEDGTFTLLVNHEVGGTAGIVRQHGATGAFVSKWIIRKSDLAVLHGGDLTKQQYLFNTSTQAFELKTSAMARLCSADLPAVSAFFNSRTGKGYSGRIFMNGEETGAEGRAFAHVVTGPGAGISYELPSLGKFSWENAVASPYEQDRTVVIGTDDSTPGQVYVYVGEKQSTGNEIEKAGLHGGMLYGIKVAGFAVEDVASSPVRTAGIPDGTRFALHGFGDVRQKTGAALQTESVAAQVTEFLRPEDGAWDTRNPNAFYFVTTDRYDGTKDGTSATVGRSRLYRLTFDDIRDPTTGGRIDMLIDGTGPNQMFDNMTVDVDGNILLQEDPGNQAHTVKVWKFYPASKRLVLVAQADPARFGDRVSGQSIPATAPFNADEEGSGIIDVTHLFTKGRAPYAFDRRGHHDDEDDFDDRVKWAKPGNRFYLGTVQAHYPLGGELVEGGQLFLLQVPKQAR
jgi:hypothetical protein